VAAKLSKIFIWPFLIGALTTLLLVVWREFYWQHALIIGIGAVALVYSAIRTVQRLKDLHKH